MNSKRAVLSSGLLLLVTLIAAGCSRNRAAQAERIEIPSLADLSSQSLVSGAGSSSAIAANTSALEAPDASACRQIEELNKNVSDSPRYSFFSRFEKDPKGNGYLASIDVSKSPFVRMFLGETFKLDTPDEFYERAHAEYRAGRLSQVKWYLLNFVRLFPSLFRGLELSTTNDKLEESFPGIFGTEESAEVSLFLKLAKASGWTADADPGTILTAELPLFSGTNPEPWETDFRKSLRAATQALSAPLDTVHGRRERICGFILWQRSFAQLLSIKGYRSIGVQGKAIVEFSDQISSFVDVPGFFMDAEKHQPVVLSSSDIQTYDPVHGKRFEVAGGVDSQLSALEALIYAFEATSPASRWFEGEGRSYVLGDLTAVKGSAILPAEAHSLAMGLMVMSFKNIASKNLVQVNAQGTPRVKQETAAGIVLLDQPQGDREVLPLSRVLKLIRSTVELDRALGEIESHSQALLSSRNSVYTNALIAQLVGSDKGSLRSGISQLPLPLAMLVLRFSDENQNCRSELDWNLRTGEQMPLGECSEELQAEYCQAIELLARHTQSSLLMRRALVCKSKAQN